MLMWCITRTKALCCMTGLGEVKIQHLLRTKSLQYAWTCCTWEVLYSCVGLLSGRWVKPSSPQSSSWGCNPSWWWRSESCLVCTRGCAGVPWPHASHSSCGTTLSTNTVKTIYIKVDAFILDNIPWTGPHTVSILSCWNNSLTIHLM